MKSLVTSNNSSFAALKQVLAIHQVLALHQVDVAHSTWPMVGIPRQIEVSSLLGRTPKCASFLATITLVSNALLRMNVVLDPSTKSSEA